MVETAGAGIASRVPWDGKSGYLKKKHMNVFFMVDKQGLLFDDMDDLTPEQKPFAKNH